MRITANTKICMVIGDPVEHSLSPVMHNAGFASIGIDDQFVFIAVKVNIKNIKHIPDIMKIMGIRGISLTIPHKLEILKYLNKSDIDTAARKIGAVNTLVNDRGKIKGFNTDWTGILKSLRSEVTNLGGAKAAIIGTGGIARAAAFALSNKKAKITIFGRDNRKAKKIADEFGGNAKPLRDLQNLIDADIIFNATPVGLHNEMETPIPREIINHNQVIFDAVYRVGGTRLLIDAQEKCSKTIDGLELLLNQGVQQFELFTGNKAPEKAMRKAIL